jgi:chemotaxis protein methyltransferase CheR
MSVSPTAGEVVAWGSYIKEICGINLDTTKGYLLETRLAPLIRETGAAGFSELLAKVKADFSKGFRRKVIDSITTNETSFFRDASPFELLRHKLLPECIDRKNRAGLRPVPIRIWSAACSTGQEAYSTGIVLTELLGNLRGYDVRILGTDISDKAVAAASYAMYGNFDLGRGMPADRIARHFTPQSDSQWKVRDEIRALATFKTMNLLEPFSFPHPFDIIFCRNVAIYFTEADKIRLFKNIARCLAKDGCLIIGSTESIAGICPEFEPKRHLRSVYYQLKG